MENFMNYDFNINKIVLATYVNPGSGNAVHQNRPSHGLAMHIGGRKNYVFSDGTHLIVEQNDIIYLPKKSNYSVTSEIIGGCYAINFDIAEDLSFSPFVCHIKNSAEVLRHFRTADNMWRLKSHSFITKCKSELYDIIYTMHHEYFSEYMPKSRFEIIKPAVAYIHDKYTAEKISVDMLSGLCGISPEYFRRIFKKFYGISPINYINNLRLLRAKELLESQLYSVSEVAMQCGYKEMCHFSREFKRAMGISPSECARINEK